MDFAEGRPVFSGRGQKPSNKEVLAAIASIKKCRQGAFFKFADKPCTCGWHTKAAVRKRARQAQSDASVTSAPTVAGSAPVTGKPSRTISCSRSPNIVMASINPVPLPLGDVPESSGFSYTTPGLNLLSPPVHPAPLHPGGVTESRGLNLLSPPVHPAPLHPGGVTESRGLNLLSPPVHPAPLHPGGVTESRGLNLLSPPVHPAPLHPGGVTESRGLNLLSPPVHPAPLHPGGVTESRGSNLLSPPVHPAPLHPGGVTESRGSNLLSDSPSVCPAPLHPGGVTESLAAASTSSTIASEVPHKTGSGPVPPKFDRSDFQAPTMRELRAIGIGIHISPSKLDLLVYCPLKGRCPHCESALITANSVGKRKLCYAIPWPKSIVGVDMRCGKCKKHFMTHDTNYVDTLPSAEQVKREFVTAKGNGSHISLLRMLRSGLTVAQVERYIDDEVKQHYLKLKANYIELWDKVHYIHMY